MTLADGKTHEQQWSLDTSVTINGKQEQIPGLISAYCKTSSILQCPVSQTPNAALTYLYSDLAASESSKDFTEPASTVAFTDSEDHLRNVGHARSRNSGSDEAVFRPEPNDTAPKLLLGAVIGDASSRHSGGANYGFADGHAKLMWPDAVFFPPRTSDSRSHREAKTGRLLGPDPAGPRTFQGKTYAATFHVR